MNLKEIIFDDWLSQIIKKNVYFLKNSFSNFNENFFPNENFLIWTKIPVTDIKKLNYLQKIGFYIVDTNVKLISSYINIDKDEDHTNIRFAKPDDEKYVKDIAKNSFEHSRFHLDPEIPYNIACSIKELWAKNFFLGRRGKWMVIAESNSEIVGFLQLTNKDDSTLVIDLIAVDKKFRGKGYAKKMIYYAYKNCLNKTDKVEVGTQISNILSLDLYARLGFKITSSYYVLHLHKKKTV